MKFLFSWGLPILALVLGIVGAVLAAKVSGGLFWVGWLPALACIAIFIFKNNEEETPEDNSDSNLTPDNPQES